MNREQNIDDILKLLKDSVASEQAPTQQSENQGVHENMSTEVLQEQLKSQYISGSEIKADDNESEYVIDSDFLNAAMSEAEEETVTDKEPEPDVEEKSVEDIINEVLQNDNFNDGADEEDIVSGAEEDDVVIENTEDEVVEEEEIISDIPIEEDAFESYNEYSNEAESASELTDSAPVLLMENEVSDIVADDLNELDDTVVLQDEAVDKESDTEFDFESIPLVEEKFTSELENIQDEDEGELFDEFFDLGTDKIELDTNEIQADEAVAQVEEPHETFLASMRKTGMDFTTDDIYNSSLNTEQDEPVEEDTPFMEDVESDEIFESDDVAIEDIDPSTVNLMMQFCDKEELEQTIGEKNVDDFFKLENATLNDKSSEEITNGREYSDKSQNDGIIERYKAKKMSKLLSLLGCGAIALLAFMFELLPIVGVSLSGVLDYTLYPAVYMLIGWQFVVFATAIKYKEIWEGLKRAFSPVPTPYSTVSLILVFTTVYDLIIAIILAFTGDDLPMLYNFVAVLVLALSSLADYLRTVSEFKAFKIYSDDAQKYTLIKEEPTGSLGLKMYGGGLSLEKNIYTVQGVDFPKGFFKSISTDSHTEKLLRLSTVPVLALAMLASVVAIIIGSDAYSACAAFILSLYMIMPMAMLLSTSISHALAISHLSKRGSAFAGNISVKEYSDADVMVFSDLHMFKKCKTEDIGFAIYDTKVGYLVLGCLDALYSKIGGPMSGMKIELPDVFKFDSVIIKRVARNGVEAIVDKKHTIIVGDHTYMQRYGLSFPQSEAHDGRSELCVSLNGKVTAKLSVKYQAEPVFEMLVERLNEDGVMCVIQTLDPLINSTVVANTRTLGNTPISVLHGDVADASSERKRSYGNKPDGVICCSSRLKLVELVIWLKRLVKIKKLSQKISIGFSAMGIVILTLLLIFGVTGYVNQMYLFGYLLLEAVAMGAIMFMIFPSDKHFTVDSLYTDMQKNQQTSETADQK